MKLEQRVDKIESALVTHLEESGAIRSDLAWLKKAFWTLAAATIAAVISNFVQIGGNHEPLSREVPQVRIVAKNSSSPAIRP